MIKKQQFLTDTENGSIFFPDENKHKLFVVSGDMNKGDFYCESDDYSFVIYVNFIPTVGDYIGGAFGGGQWLWIYFIKRVNSRYYGLDGEIYIYIDKSIEADALCDLDEIKDESSKKAMKGINRMLERHANNKY